jgi:hypothetical protein
MENDEEPITMVEILANLALGALIGGMVVCTVVIVGGVLLSLL